MTNHDPQSLVQDALQAARQAHAPYSNFHVGAVVVDKSGKHYTGCNVENASFGLTCCAERVALFKAVSEGTEEIVALAVASPDHAGPLPPCGACRQVIMELAPQAKVYLGAGDGGYDETSPRELLPGAFGVAQ